VFLGNAYGFNGFNPFTWFNMGRITENNRCLINTIKTETRKRAVDYYTTAYRRSDADVAFGGATSLASDVS